GDGGREVVAGDASEERGIDDVLRGGGDDHVLVAFHGAGFVGGDEGGADVGEVCAHGLGCEDLAAGGDRAGERARTVEEFTDLGNEREGRQRAGMAACPGTDGDEAVSAFLERLVGEDDVDDVVQDDAAIGVDGVVDLGPGAEGGDDHRNL